MIRKFILAALLIFAVTASFSARAEDMTTVWTELSTLPDMITASVSQQKAEANGFRSLSVSLNSAPTTKDIDKVLNLATSIEDSQKVTAVNRDDINVQIFAAPASVDAKIYKIMILVTKETGEDHSLIVLYGETDSADITKVLQNLSLEDLIG